MIRGKSMTTRTPPINLLGQALLGVLEACLPSACRANCFLARKAPMPRRRRFRSPSTPIPKP